MAPSDPYDLQRFRTAQDDVFDNALQELRQGRKRGHWMWYIFPQIAGLGRSATAQAYAISSFEEASSYLAHPILGPRLRQAAEALLTWLGERDADVIFGPLDAIKLRSSLTLFDAVSPGGLFGHLLDGFFGGPDPRTLALLAQQR